MTTNRDYIDGRIESHLKYKFSPDYKVLGVRTKWIGQRDGEKFFFVRYFLTSTRFVGGVRYDKVSVTGKEIRDIYEDDI